MPYCIPSSKPRGRFLRMTLRMVSRAARRSGGRAAKYFSTVSARLVTMKSPYHIPARGPRPRSKDDRRFSRCEGASAVLRISTGPNDLQGSGLVVHARKLDIDHAQHGVVEPRDE